MIGAGGHAHVVADAASLSGFELLAVLSEADRGAHFNDFQVQSLEVLEQHRRSGVRWVHVAIGNCEARQRLGVLALSLGFELLQIVHPRATVSPKAHLADGVFVAAGAVIAAEAHVGRAAIINHNASVDHHCRIGAYSHVCPGTNLGGHVLVGTGSWLGLGCRVRDRVKIGANCLIGAGALVLSDLADNVLAYGQPARVMGPNPR
jgi:sugar O-acyltransferase (sialic acid O-acetyltransferase NeuD family)